MVIFHSYVNLPEGIFWRETPILCSFLGYFMIFGWRCWSAWSIPGPSSTQNQRFKWWIFLEIVNISGEFQSNDDFLRFIIGFLMFQMVFTWYSLRTEDWSIDFHTVLIPTSPWLAYEEYAFRSCEKSYSPYVFTLDVWFSKNRPWHAMAMAKKVPRSSQRFRIIHGLSMVCWPLRKENWPKWSYF